MQAAHDGDHFKTFTDSVDTIGKLGQRLAALQADVVAIEGLNVDDNGDAEAVVSVNNSSSLHIGLRIPPSAMLLVKREEINRAITALRAEFGDILDHAETLSSRCRPQPNVQIAPPRMNIDLDVLEKMTRDMEHEIQAAPPSPVRSHAPDRKPPLDPQSRLRGIFFNRRPLAPAAE